MKRTEGPTQGLATRATPEASAQLSLALEVIERHLASTLLAVHLYGSSLDGGLRPYSDIDLLVTVVERPDELVRRALLLDLLEVSAPPAESRELRALEVTVVVRDDVVPWHYPVRRELQFGEWLREDILADIVEPPVMDADLAIVITKARQNSIALAGRPAEQIFDPVPEADFFLALADTLKLWNAPADWAGDERNVVLTLARVWYSAATGRIASKDAAADWVMDRLPVDLQPILLAARQAYLGGGGDGLVARADELAAFVALVKGKATELLDASKDDV